MKTQRIKYKIMVVTVTDGPLRLYGWYIGYKPEELINIALNFPKHWAWSYSKD